MYCFCGEQLRTQTEYNNGCCDKCQQAARQVWDKDAFVLGQEGKLDWTSAEEDERGYIESLGYKGDTIYE